MSPVILHVPNVPKVRFVTKEKVRVKGFLLCLGNRSRVPTYEDSRSLRTLRVVYSSEP